VVCGAGAVPRKQEGNAFVKGTGVNRDQPKLEPSGPRHVDVTAHFRKGTGPPHLAIAHFIRDVSQGTFQPGEAGSSYSNKVTGARCGPSLRDGAQREREREREREKEREMERWGSREREREWRGGQGERKETSDSTISRATSSPERPVAGTPACSMGWAVDSPQRETGREKERKRG
jgi:hypothetical protein